MNTKDQLVWDYLDGSLSQTERADFEKKLAEDLELQVLYNKAVKLDESLVALPIITAPEDILVNVNKRIAQIKRRPQREYSYQGMSIILLSIFALIILLFVAALVTEPIAVNTVNDAFNLAQYLGSPSKVMADSFVRYDHLLPYSLLLVGLPLGFWLERLSLKVIPT